MMLIENIIIYLLTITIGILVGVVFSKLIFLMLLNVANIQIDAQFTISGMSILKTIIYFGVLMLFNVGYSIWQVVKAKPIDLMKETKKGERQVKWLPLKSLLGFILLGLGYYTALHTEVDSMIFINFFCEVLLVVLGTRFLFSAGSITILNKLKQTKSIYYKKSNFITISGMLYRMKRNAQSLANICIFSTMIIITLIFTVSVYTQKEEAIMFEYPLDNVYIFENNQFKAYDELDEVIKASSQTTNVSYTNMHKLIYQPIDVYLDHGKIMQRIDDSYSMDALTARVMTLEDYNACEHQQMKLNDDEILFFGPNMDLNTEEVQFGSKHFKVKEELQAFSFERKQNKTLYCGYFYIVVPSQEIMQEIIAEMGESATHGSIYQIGFDLGGTKEQREQFVMLNSQWCEQQSGFKDYRYIDDYEQMGATMLGGLIFLGLFFGIIFTVCTVLMMYYKQLTEGYEDQRNFEIFKQVGMSDKEIKSTIKKQVLLVFFIPLLMAILHTLVALKVINNLLAVIYVYDSTLILLSCVGVVSLFAVIYVICYSITSRVYYNIVK